MRRREWRREEERAATKYRRDLTGCEHRKSDAAVTDIVNEHPGRMVNGNNTAVVAGKER
jgi:hypothetical protein